MNYGLASATLRRVQQQKSCKTRIKVQSHARARSVLGSSLTQNPTLLSRVRLFSRTPSWNSYPHICLFSIFSLLRNGHLFFSESNAVASSSQIFIITGRRTRALHARDDDRRDDDRRQKRDDIHSGISGRLFNKIFKFSNDISWKSAV